VYSYTCSGFQNRGCCKSMSAQWRPLVKVKDDPRLAGQWPPLEWGTAGAPSHGTVGRLAPPAGVGVLIDVKCVNSPPSRHITLVKEHNGQRFRAQIVIEDGDFRRTLYEVLRRYTGLTIAEIGEKDLDLWSHADKRLVGCSHLKPNTGNRVFDSLRKLWQRYSSGKQFGEKYQRARAVIQLALFQKLRNQRKVNAISSFLFSEEPPKEIDYPNLERDAFAALDEDPELEELVWETLVVKLGLCRAYDNRDLFERILEGPVFKNMGGKRPVRDVAHYARLIDRIYARFSGKQGGAESKGNQGQRGFPDA